MTLVLLIGLALVGASAVLIARAVALPRLRMAERLDQISAYGLLPHAETADEDRRPLADLAGRLGAAVISRTERIDAQEVRKLLLAAGHYGVRPETFVGYRVLAPVTLGALGVLAVGADVRGLLMTAGLAFIGWMAPLSLLRVAAQRRADAIDRGMPDLVDLLVVTVEAGLSFGSAMQVAARRIDGPLADELRLTLQEQRMGLPITSALTNMLERVDTPSVRSFVRSVVQGETLGVSVGTILRAVADETRKRRRAAAEEQANKAPVKMLFPLIFLIFPALFLILLGPGAMMLIKGLGGM